MPPVRIAALTDTGHARGRNEDAHHVDPARGLAVVADGMGGHPAGDRASRLAVDEVVARLADGTRAAVVTPEDGERDRDGDMAEAVRGANRRILDDGREHPEHRGMGTTLTVLQVGPDRTRFRVGHVGDSRCYLYRDGALRPLTRDHTPVQDEVEAGRLSREEARLHPMSHMLSQALGTADRVEPQVVSGEVEAGDLFLLCTDGLNAVLSDDEITSIIREGGVSEPAGIARALVERTLEGGAPDNVTVALVLVP